MAQNGKGHAPFAYDRCALPQLKVGIGPARFATLGYSFNLVHLLQSKDRIHRLGLPNDQYTQFYYLQPVFKSPEGYFSMSEQIYERLKEKERVMLQAIEGGVLETQPTTEEELDAIFQQVLQ